MLKINKVLFVFFSTLLTVIDRISTYRLNDKVNDHDYESWLLGSYIFKKQNYVCPLDLQNLPAYDITNNSLHIGYIKAYNVAF